MRWTALALMAAVALGCAATPLPEIAPTSVSPLSFGRGQWRVVDQVVLLTDASGSMYAHKTFPEAKAATLSFINGMPAANSPSRGGATLDAGLIAFGGEDRVTAPLAPFDRAALTSKAQSIQIMGDIDGRGGETPYRHVFPEAQQQIAGKSGQSAIVLFSDGLPDYPDQAMSAAKALAASHEGKVCFHAVWTGTDPVGEQNLKNIAALFPCGSVRSVDSIRDPNGLMGFERAVFAGTAPPPPPTPVVSECEGVIRLRGINFAFDKANITPDSAVVLDVAVDILKKCSSIRMEIDGYTDSTGPEAYNMGLSQRRADAVKRYFVSQGVSSARLTTRGFGESDPIDTNATREGRAKNRRVELHPVK